MTAAPPQQDPFFTQIDKLWIQPELDRRRQEGKLPDGFVIYQALIRLPYGRPPIVEFNNEIHWRAKLSVAPDVDLQKGDTVYMYHVQRVDTVDPPLFEDKRVAFIYLWHRGGGNYRILFDFSPNAPNFDPETESWPYGKQVAESIREIIDEHVIRIFEPRERDLARIGLWAAPRLMPYPLSEIVRVRGRRR